MAASEAREYNRLFEIRGSNVEKLNETIFLEETVITCNDGIMSVVSLWTIVYCGGVLVFFKKGFIRIEGKENLRIVGLEIILWSLSSVG